MYLHAFNACASIFLSWFCSGFGVQPKATQSWLLYPPPTRSALTSGVTFPCVVSLSIILIIIITLRRYSSNLSTSARRWNTVQTKAWQFLEEQDFFCLFLSIPVNPTNARRWDRSAEQTPAAGATSSHCLFSGCVQCPPGSEQKWKSIISQSVWKMTHRIIFYI